MLGCYNGFFIAESVTVLSCVLLQFYFTLNSLKFVVYKEKVLFAYKDQVQEREMQKFLGLDFSMHELYRDSNGKEPADLSYYRNAEKRLAREQRKLSRMQKGSNNRNKQRIKVAKLHEKVSDQRKDFLHKQSRQITNAYECVYRRLGYESNVTDAKFWKICFR